MDGSRPVKVPPYGDAQSPGTRRTMNLKEAAEYLGISRSHLLNIIKGAVKEVPHLKPIRVGRRLLFRPERLNQWLRDAESKTSGTNHEDVLAPEDQERC
jgi:excisionase family DNA binding protein